MKADVIENIEDFLNDFNYFKLKGYDVFHSPIKGGNKLVVINTTPYEDGIMLEVQLAVSIARLEELIFNFYQQEFNKLSLSYWESLSLIASTISKRSFVKNRLELSKVLHQIEDALVKKGFKWLDAISDLRSLSKYIHGIVFTSGQKPFNMYKLSQRSLLLRYMLEEQITESVFYNYYEQLQIYKVPDHQLQEFLAFKSHLDAEFT